MHRYKLHYDKFSNREIVFSTPAEKDEMVWFSQ